MILNHPTFTLVGFLIVIVLLFFLIARVKWHVFMALLLPIILFALIPGVDHKAFISAFESGFGSTIKSIAVVIVLGSVIAEALKETGGIEKITLKMIDWVGQKNMPLALTLTGFVIGLAIFSDVGYVILNPLVHSAALASGINMSVMSTGLVGAMQLTHAIVPPTPGPLAAAALLKADVGKIILFGSIVTFIGSIAGWLFALIVGPKISSPPSEEFVGQSFADKGLELPSTLSAYAPIILPLVFIAGASIANLYLPDGLFKTSLNFIGWPPVALLIGIWLAFRNTNPEQKKLQNDKWIENALRNSAMIIMVTGLGGSLSAILKGTPAVDFIAQTVLNSGVPSIFLPFVLGIVGNVITGSTTVGVITSASIVAPMLTSLGLSPEAAMLAAGAGSVIIKYVNSSYFWVCASLSRMELKSALYSYGGVTLVGGIFSMAAVYVMWLINLI